ncbi:MAG TPA: M28 family peptidase [Candidatus Sulfotelmatobacter sp.]|jgi:glutaminyl-peptide cyclotransferase|nr:M28 family peptidase [Candidatus Sulfotelmatobacter sp.]
MVNSRGKSLFAWVLFVAMLGVAACNHTGASADSSASTASASQAASQNNAAAAKPTESAPPASQTGGFDGAKAYDQVAKIVSFGPRPPESEGIHLVQDYIRAQLQGFGCTVVEDDFHAATPAGPIAMKNIIAKMPGTGQGIILLLTHYDSLGSVKNFVGAEDSASSTGVMLEMARLLCGKKQANAVWIAFLDGEEAIINWDRDDDHTYGSRELAASLAVSGDMKKVKAIILADMIGQYNLEIPRQNAENSTRWLTDIVWKTAARLGYQDTFVLRETNISDDHQPFLARGMPAIDIIDYDGYQNPKYWHTDQDTLDKVSPRSLAIVGHVILESVNELQKKFH